LGRKVVNEIFHFIDIVFHIFGVHDAFSGVDFKIASFSNIIMAPIVLKKVLLELVVSH